MYGSIRTEAIFDRTGTERLNESNTVPRVGASWQLDRWLELTPRANQSGYEILASAVEGNNRRELGAIFANDPSPRLPWGGAPVSRAMALDVLKHAIDEAAWLKAIVEVLEPGGELIVRVPLEGPVAWLDALNLIRYMQDITGGSQPLTEVTMKGWHRHYRPGEIEQLLGDAGMVVTHVARSGSPHVEFANLARLMVTGLAKGGDRDPNRNRDNPGADAKLVRLGPFSTKLTVRAIKLVNP